jgi:hypothetical protein
VSRNFCCDIWERIFLAALPDSELANNIFRSLGAVYIAGYFQMSTWIPFVWALINVFVLILSSFSIQGGL